jgi:cell division septal protein FtsQ
MIQRIGSGFLKVFFMFAVIAGISLSFLFFYSYLLTSPYMKLELVEVDGVDETIRKELIQMCGLNSDLTLVALNLNKLKQKMEKHPWVRSVKLERRFPHTLIVQAEKEHPRALAVMDKIYYLNQWGEIFKEVDEWDEMDFPAVTGVSEPGAEGAEQLARAADIMRLLESEEGLWSLSELSEIHVEKDGGISLYFSHLAAEIKLARDLSPLADTHLGPEGDLMNKIDGLKKVAEHLSRTGRIHQVSGIDLSHVDGAVVSFRRS